MKTVRLAPPAMLGLLAGTVVTPVAAQSAVPTTQPDLVPVVLWTFTVVILSMLALSLGYLYRRTRGDPDEIIPIYVEPAGGENQAPAHDAGPGHGAH